MNNVVSLHPIRVGVVAQLVEQRTENPCVTGSIPVDATGEASERRLLFFVLVNLFPFYGLFAMYCSE